MPGPYHTLLLDPPWLERGGGKIKRGADRHYALVKTADMPALILESGAWAPAEHAHVYMWVTANHLDDGLWLMRELGVRYVNHFVWVKLRKNGLAGVLTALLGRWRHGDEGWWNGLLELLAFGLGQYVRGSHELLLFGVIGKGKDPSVMTEAKNIRSVFFAPVGEHSVKPDASYSLIEARSHGPRIEFFARRARPGWAVWGNEAPKEET